MGRSDSRLRAAVSEDLEAVSRWQLSPSQWALIHDELSGVSAALEDGDSERVVALTRSVVARGPRRRGRAALDSEVLDGPSPPPPEVVELLNHIVHGVDDTDPPSAISQST